MSALCDSIQLKYHDMVLMSPVAAPPGLQVSGNTLVQVSA